MTNTEPDNDNDGNNFRSPTIKDIVDAARKGETVPFFGSHGEEDAGNIKEIE